MGVKDRLEPFPGRCHECLTSVLSLSSCDCELSLVDFDCVGVVSGLLSVLAEWLIRRTLAR